MYPAFSIGKYLKELLRPWKLVTFSLALSYYIWGALYYRLPTWDVPVSIIMSVLTYVFSPWVVNSLLYLVKARPKGLILKLVICLAVTYACASGSYELYHMLWGIGYHPPTYWVNLYYSTLIFLAAGIFWKFEGTFIELMQRSKADLWKTYRTNRFLFVSASLFLAISLIFGIYHSLQIPKF